MRNTFGNIFTLTTFGESHGEAVGGVVDGMPAGVDIDLDFIQHELSRRRPGQSRVTTSRNEPDKVEILSGVFEGKSTGTPIGFIVRNTNQHSKDYDNIRELFRPSHADYTYYNKYGIRDHRGGGRSSARITINLSKTEESIVRCPDAEKAKEMEELIMKVKADGDTIGGIVTGVISGCPVGLGEPEFGKLHAQLGAAMLSINAVKGFEYGDGFSIVTHRGSEVNDSLVPTPENGKAPAFRSNHSGGIQGGISNGEDIFFRVAFKPVATLLMPQPTIDIHGNATIVDVRGRHDPCVVPRAVPIVESMAAMVILDNYLLDKTCRL